MRLFSSQFMKATVARQTLLLALLSLGVWVLLLSYGSRNGFDGDSVALLSGILHFDDRGPENVYRYYWQPLNYELFSSLLRLGMPVSLLFVLPAFAGSATVTMLSVAAHRESKSWVIAIGSVLLLPELLHSSLYFNPTIIGAVPFACAILVARSPLPPVSRGIAIGALAAAAVLFRLDYVLALPLLACWSVDRSCTRAAVSAAVAFMTLTILAMATGLISPMRIVGVLGSYHDDVRTTGFEGWTLRDNLRVISTMALTLAALGTAIILVWPRRFGADVVAWTGAAAFAALPFLALESPKYALPGLLFTPLLVARAFGQVAHQRVVRVALIAVLAVAYLAPAGSLKHTQDGERVRYGYLAWWSGPDGPRVSMPIWAEFQHRLAVSIADIPGCTRVYPPNEAEADWSGEWMVWTWPSMYLEQAGFETRRYSLLNGIALTRGATAVTLYPRMPGSSAACQDVILPTLGGTWYEVRDRFVAFWRAHPELERP